MNNILYLGDAMELWKSIYFTEDWGSKTWVVVVTTLDGVINATKKDRKEKWQIVLPNIIGPLIYQNNFFTKLQWGWKLEIFDNETEVRRISKNNFGPYNNPVFHEQAITIGKINKIFPKKVNPSLHTQPYCPLPHHIGQCFDSPDLVDSSSQQIAAERCPSQDGG